MRNFGLRHRNFHRDRMHGIIAVILSAFFFLVLCATTIRADAAQPVELKPNLERVSQPLTTD